MAGLSLLVGLAGVTTYALVRDPPYVAPPPRSAAPQARPAQAAVALHALVVALEAGDGAAAARLAPDDDPAAADLLRAVAGNAADLGLVVDLRYVDETGAVDPDGSWSAAVAATWRYAADDASARAELTVGFRPVTADAVAVTGFGGTAAARVPVWLAGPVTVRDAGGVEVVVSGTGASADRAATRYLRLAERAVVVVHRVLPDWRANLVVEVPASGAALDRALGSEPGHYRSIAAVTATVDGSSAGEAPVHVFVNPDIFDRLRSHRCAGRGQSRGRARGHRRRPQQRPAVAAGGLRRLRRAARRRPADHHRRRSDHPSGPPRGRARSAAGACRVRHEHDPSRCYLRERLARLRAAGRSRWRSEPWSGSTTT